MVDGTVSDRLDVTAPAGAPPRFRQVRDTFRVQAPHDRATVARDGDEAGTGPGGGQGGGDGQGYVGSPGTTGADAPTAPDGGSQDGAGGYGEPSHPDQPEPADPQDGTTDDPDALATPEATEACVALLEVDDADEQALLDDPDFVTCLENYAADPTDSTHWTVDLPGALPGAVGPTD